MIAWGTFPILVEHLTPPRSFFLGEDPSHPDIPILPNGSVGSARAPLLLVDRDGVMLVLLPSATGLLELTGEHPISVEQAIKDCRARPLPDWPSAYALPFPRGSKAWIRLSSMTPESPYRAPHPAPDIVEEDHRLFIHVADIPAERAPSRALRAPSRSAAVIAAAIAVQTGIFYITGLSAPPPHVAGDVDVPDRAWPAWLPLAAEDLTNEDWRAPPLGATGHVMDEGKIWMAAVLAELDDEHAVKQLRPKVVGAVDFCGCDDLLRMAAIDWDPTWWPEIPGRLFSREQLLGLHALAGDMLHDAIVATSANPYSMQVPAYPVSVGSTGGVDADRARRALASIRYPLGACLSGGREGAREPANVQIVIDRRGAVTALTARNSSGAHHTATGCIRRALQRVEFPAPSEGTVVITASLKVRVGAPRDIAK